MSNPTLQQSDNGFWYITWSDGRRSKRVSTRQKDLPAAKAFFGQWLLMEQAAPKAANTVFTVADLWAVYKAKHIDTVSASPDSIINAWKAIYLFFGKYTVVEIDQDLINDYEKARVSGRVGRKVKPPTVRKELHFLRACLNWCAHPKRKLLEPGQVPLFDVPAPGAPRDRWLRHGEIQALLIAAAELRRGDRLSRGERFLWLALETGARKTALFELTWDRVDFETNVIHLNVPGRKVTKKRRADVPISKALRPILERAHRERTNDYVLDHSADVWRSVQAIAKRAGFKNVGVLRTGISPHVLRHTAATHMARRGVPLWKIAKVLGNSLAMVEKVYSHHSPEDLREAVDVISGGILEAAE